MANIFYGIYGVENISDKLKKWVGAIGEPDVFCERDELVARYQPKLLDKYDVITIDEALKRYPEALVWITWAHPAHIPNMLAKKIPPERIRFLEADLEYRKGCGCLGKFMLYGEKFFAPCSVINRMAKVRTYGTVRQRVEQWHQFVTKLIEANQVGANNKCKGCHQMYEAFWPKTVKLSQISFATSNRGDVCNFRCTYCLTSKNLEAIKELGEGITAYEMLQELAEIPELDTEELTIRFANGEFCAHKYCNEMLDVFLKTKWKFDLVSNCSLYREKLHNLIEAGRVVSIITSPDAGTRETFKKIKQVDMFDKVVENLRKYPIEKTRLAMKYIFLEGINDNEVDVDGFYDLAKEIGATIMFSADYLKPYTEKMKELSIRIMDKAKADGVKITVDTNHIHPQDATFVVDYSKKTC
jgi:wyosine [tRNA(Phe)-imidazoG37] synthetase (radical SAM superfamily)